MSDQETRPADQDDVEAHKRRPVQASDEPRSEGESDDEDVELHKRRPVQASDEPKGEGEADDDVELHRRRSS